MAKKITVEDILLKHPLLTKEVFTDYYINKEFSLPDFKESFGITFNQTSLLIKYYLLPKRNISKSKLTNRSKEKTLKTFNQKYGSMIKNVSQIESVKEKKRQTNLTKHGVDNIRKSEWFKQHYIKIMHQRYGKGSTPNTFGNMNKWWEAQTPEERSVRMKVVWGGSINWRNNLTDEERSKHYDKITKTIRHIGSSKLEARVVSALTLVEIPVTTQYWINRRSYDIRIKNTNLLIEVNGDYWHANPEIYQADSKIKYPSGIKFAKEMWQKDLDKTKNANEYNYEVLSIWEKDINNIKDDSELGIWLIQKIEEYNGN